MVDSLHLKTVTRTFHGIALRFGMLFLVVDPTWAGDCLPDSRENCRSDYSMPSASMTPTLLSGDYFFVDAERYNTHWPELGEVVVFLLPTDNKFKYVKRVIGFPGDHVLMKGGVLFINGVAVPKVRVEDFVDNRPNGEGNGRAIAQYEETLPNGISYRVLDQQANGPGDDTMEYVVPVDHYFMMGDNRDNSEDSRYLRQVGYVPRLNIIAKATTIYFSWKFSQIGKKVE